jgi:phage-related protein
MEFEVSFYTREDGTKPAKAFIVALEPKMRAKMYRTIDMLEANGHELREPYSKHLDDGIFELRAKVGTDISRVLYFFFVGRKVILTNGILKKSRQTPTNEIQRAKNYRSEYLRREENRR